MFDDLKRIVLQLGQYMKAESICGNVMQCTDIEGELPAKVDSWGG